MCERTDTFTAAERIQVARGPGSYKKVGQCCCRHRRRPRLPRRRLSNLVLMVVGGSWQWVVVVVLLVVVVVQTRCNDEMFIHDAARDAPNYGGRVPVDTAPGPVPVYREFVSQFTQCA